MSFRDKLASAATGMGPVFATVDRILEALDGKAGLPPQAFTVTRGDVGARNSLEDALPIITNALETSGCQVLSVEHQPWADMAKMTVAPVPATQSSPPPIAQQGAAPALPDKLAIGGTLQVERLERREDLAIVQARDIRVTVSQNGVLIEVPTGPLLVSEWSKVTYAGMRHRPGTFWYWELAVDTSLGSHHVLFVTVGPESLGTTDGHKAVTLFDFIKAKVGIVEHPPAWDPRGTWLDQYLIPAAGS